MATLPSSLRAARAPRRLQPPDGRARRAERGPLLVPLAAYATLALVAVGGAAVQGRSPLAVEPWLPLEGPAGHALSLALGIGLAAATVRASRTFVRRFGWARALHADLRPSIRHETGGTLVALGVASAIGEELLFRGLLATLLGVVLSSLGFGLLHQVRGEGRWAWVGWASVMGLLFGVLYVATGSLLGPIVAHAGINVANLRFLRDTDVEAPRQGRRLGGLLGRA